MFEEVVKIEYDLKLIKFYACDVTSLAYEAFYNKSLQNCILITRIRVQTADT